MELKGQISATEKRKKNPKTSSAKHSSESYTNFKDQLESNRSVLKEQLGASNYMKKFHYLLYWEEQEHARQLGERYCNN